MLAFVPLPPWYSPTQSPACQLTLNVTKPRPFTHFAAKLFATSSRPIMPLVTGCVCDIVSFSRLRRLRFPYRQLLQTATKTSYMYYTL